ncbi:hypothetical protein SNK03_010350 [Fusarium graminearum]
MHFSSVVVQTLLAIGVTVARNEKFRRGVKPNGPIDPGITSKCTYYDEWMDNGYTNCQKWLMDWAITEQKFSEYNPTVDDDCSDIKVGHSYCVEINHGLPEEPDKPEVTSTDISGSETTDTKERHILNQEGLIESCVDLHKASEADTCDQIVSSFSTFDFDTFFHMESSCSKNPTVLQKGLIKGCALFHQAGKGDTCAKIVSNLELLNMNAFYK